MQEPKRFFKPFKNRNKAIGKERRRNAVKETLQYQPHFPKTVTYEDIDQAIFDIVDKEWELVYEGKKFPTYKLFSTQRISEYGQNWDKIDDKGNLEVNFKTITRENNPQHGDGQGNIYNVPGNRDYTIFQTYAQEEDGNEVVELYTMKQPFSVNLMYSFSVITDKYTIINEINNKILKEFKSLEKYVFPNGFAMPILLDSISDESDYTIDDRKYYAQTFKLKVMAYIINQEDYTVKKIPSKTNIFVSGENSKNKAKKKKFKLNTLNNYGTTSSDNKIENSCSKSEISVSERDVDINKDFCPMSGHSELNIEEISGMQTCFKDTEDEIYVNEKVIINVSLGYCEKKLEFEMTQALEVESIYMSNIDSVSFFINGENINYENSDIVFDTGDVLKISYTLKDETKCGQLAITCYDPASIVLNTLENKDNKEIINI